MVMLPWRVRAWIEIKASGVAGFACDVMELCTDPRSLLASTVAAVPSLMPTSMFPEPVISFA